MNRLSNFRLTLISLILTCVSLSNLHAQNTYALVIGLSQYKEITPLQFADRDAVAFAEFLKTQRVPETNIKLILNENATRLNVLDGMYNLTSQLKPKDRFYFYFGGHGDLEAQISSDNSLLLLYNSFKKNYFQGSEFIQLFELKEWLGDLAKKQIEVVFIADACHSGGLIGGKEGISKTQTALNENWAGITKILSCKSDEFSLEGKQWGGGRGLFSYHLVNGLIGRADANGDKKISVGELDNYLKSNVLKQANPNVQTPIVIGNNKQVLSIANIEGLDKIAELEQKNFALMTEVNTRGDDKSNLDELAKLDTTIVETYKKFSKALKEKRIAPHDDSLDCALIHYRKLETYKLPDNLSQMIKRNMAVGLMELELDLLKDAREKGYGGIPRTPKIEQAIINLKEAQKLFGKEHYIYKYLEARKSVLEANRPYNIIQTQSTDELLKKGKEKEQKAREYLLESLKLEPNMISTYCLLSIAYQIAGNPDSSIYYQEKVVKLLPNQVWAYYNLGRAYEGVKFKDTNNRPVPHPKAIQSFKKTIEIDSNLRGAYEILGNLYMNLSSIEKGESADSSYRNYLEAIPYFEKLLSFYEVSVEELLKMDLNNYSANQMFKLNEDKVRVYDMFHYYSMLHFLYKGLGNQVKAEEYMNKIRSKALAAASVFSYMNAGNKMYRLFGWEENDVYLTYALDFIQKALKKANDVLQEASTEDKPLQTLQYRELLKAVGTTHRALKNYTEAEKFLQQALSYPVLESPIKGKLKFQGGVGTVTNMRMIMYPRGIARQGSDYYRYGIEANIEMFFLKLEQNMPEEALIWYEKALQHEVTEYGNDTSGKPMTEAVLKTYKNINKEAFLKLRYKYFPNAEKVD